LLYGSKNWIIKATDTTITAAVMNHMRKTETYTAKELNITPVLYKIQE